MSDRNRLIELIDNFYKEELGTNFNKDILDKFADYLLANGVICLPCKVGDKVYYVHETLLDKNYKNHITSKKDYKNRILKIVERPKHFTNLTVEVIKFDYCFITDWLNGDIFLTKEEAEQALAERSVNNG